MPIGEHRQEILKKALTEKDKRLKKTRSMLQRVVSIYQKLLPFKILSEDERDINPGLIPKTPSGMGTPNAR